MGSVLEVCSFLFNPLLCKRVCKHSGPNGDRYRLNDVYSRLSGAYIRLSGVQSRLNGAQSRRNGV